MASGNNSNDALHEKYPPLAIVGFSLKFPQDATSPESFWNLLQVRKCAMTEFSGDRLNIEAFYHPDTTRKDTIAFCGGHFIKGDLGEFDASFFSIPGAEAADMEPMQRGLLECTYRAVENAGISMSELIGSKTSVHTGCFTSDYSTLLSKDPLSAPRYAATGLSAAMLANRISWFFNLSGASVNPARPLFPWRQRLPTAQGIYGWVLTSL